MATEDDERHDRKVIKRLDFLLAWAENLAERMDRIERALATPRGPKSARKPATQRAAE